MNSLPNEIFEIIINKIDIYERFKLRSVCKRWSTLILNLKSKCLVVASKYEGIITQRWFDTDKRINLQNLLSNRKFSFLLSESCVKGLCGSVKELAIYNINQQSGSSNFELILNSFKQTIRLDLNLVEDVSGPINLFLPDLRVICIDSCATSFIIDSRCLSKIKYVESGMERTKFVKLTNPLTVEYVEMDRYYEFLEEFKNLKYLYLDYRSFVDLRHFTHLNEIHFECAQLEYVQDVLKQKDHLKLENLVITNFGIRIDDLTGQKIMEKLQVNYEFNARAAVIYIQNYDLVIDRLQFVSSLVFDGFEQILPKAPKNFFKKFTNLNEVIAREKINDYQTFIEFISKCNRFPHLSLYDTKLDQVFFDRLPEICWFIQILALGTKCSSKKLNCEFILKLNYLNTLVINHDICFQFIEKICSKLRFLKSFFFTYKKQVHSIKYLEFRNQFELNLEFDSSTKTYANLDAILEQLKD